MKYSPICTKRSKKFIKDKFFTNNKYFLLTIKSNFFKKTPILTLKMYTRTNSKTQFTCLSPVTKSSQIKRWKLPTSSYKFMEMNKTSSPNKNFLNPTLINIYSSKRICKNSLNFSFKKQKLQPEQKPQFLKQI